MKSCQKYTNKKKLQNYQNMLNENYSFEFVEYDFEQWKLYQIDNKNMQDHNPTALIIAVQICEFEIK